jgi:hypothetical protein
MAQNASLPREGSPVEEMVRFFQLVVSILDPSFSFRMPFLM